MGNPTGVHGGIGLVNAAEAVAENQDFRLAEIVFERSDCRVVLNSFKCTSCLARQKAKNISRFTILFISLFPIHTFFICRINANGILQIFLISFLDILLRNHVSRHLLHLEHTELVEATHFAHITHAVCNGIRSNVAHRILSAEFDSSSIHHLADFLCNHISRKFSTARSPVRIVVQVKRTFNGIARLRRQKRRVQIHRVKASTSQRIENFLAVRLEPGGIFSTRDSRIAPSQAFGINARLARSHHHQEFHALRLELVAEPFNRLHRIVELCTAHIKRRRLHQEFHILAVEKPTVGSRGGIASTARTDAIASSAKHHLLARITKEIPNRKLVLGAQRQYNRALVINLIFKSTQIAARPYAVMLHVQERTPQRHMTKIRHESLDARIRLRERFRFVLQLREERIRQLEALVTSFSGIKFGIRIHRKHSRFQVRK